MEIKTKKLPASRVEFEVSLPFSEFEPYLKKGAIKLSEEKDVEGFRKGKAPYEMVKEKFGEQLILEKAADEALRNTYPQAMKKALEDIGQKTSFPIGHPEITVTKIAKGNDFDYKVLVSLYPVVELGHYLEKVKKIIKEEKPVEVSELEVQNTLEWLRKSRAPIITVSREAKKGDFCEVDFEVRSEGVKIELGDSRNHVVEIGANKFMAGFEDNLIGMKAQGTKEFILESPQDWYRKEFAGKKLEFKVLMKSVQERVLPDLNDEFAKTLGTFTNMDGLKKSIEEGLIKEKQEKENQRIKMDIASSIADSAKIEVPDIMIERELDKMTEELMSGIKDMGMQWEDYLTHIKKTSAELRKDWRGDALKRVRIALVLREIGLKEKLEPTEEEVKERTNEILKQYSSVKEAEQKIDAETLREYAKGVLRNEKVFEFLERKN